VTDILRKKDVDKKLGVSEYDMDGILGCKIQLRSYVVSIDFNCNTLFAR
jgi:hypothetical protein